jgi:hypothetical protein
MNIVSNRCNDVKRSVIENRFFFGYTSLLILIFQIYLSLIEIADALNAVARRLRVHQEEKKITSGYCATALMCPATIRQP